MKFKEVFVGKAIKKQNRFTLAKIYAPESLAWRAYAKPINDDLIKRRSRRYAIGYKVSA